MNLEEALAELQALGDEQVRARNRKSASDGRSLKQFGVPLGKIRAVAKKAKTDPELAAALWTTGNVDAQLLAVLLMKPKTIAKDEVSKLVRSAALLQVADWLHAYVVKKHPDKDGLREAWLTSNHPMEARAGWALTADQVAQVPERLDLKALLDRIEAELVDVAPEVQWTMNNTLAAIGIHAADFRPRALAIGEALGLYRDYPVSKGCTSPFAPIWIREMVGRQA